MVTYHFFACFGKTKPSRYPRGFFPITTLILLLYIVAQAVLFSMAKEILLQNILVIVTVNFHAGFLLAELVFFGLFLSNSAKYSFRKFKTREFAFSLVICFGLGFILFCVIIGDFLIKIAEINSYTAYYNQKDVVASE